MKGDSNLDGNLSIVQCLAMLGDSDVRDLLTNAGINPNGSLADCDPYLIASFVWPLAVARSNQSLGTILPNLLRASERSLPMGDLSERARNVLEKFNIRSFGSLASHSHASLRSLRSAGDRTVEEYTRFAVRLHIQVHTILPVSEAPPPVPPPPKLASALKLIEEIAAWASTTHRTSTFGDLFTLAIDSLTLPSDVADELTALRGISLSECIVPDAGAKDGVEKLLGKLNEVQMAIFGARHQLIADRPSLTDLARKHGVSRERVRQVENRACEILRAEFATLPQAPLRWRLHELASVIRNGMPETALTLTEALATAFCGVATSPAMKDLLLWLAGPYVCCDGWILREGCDVPKVPIDDPRFGGGEVKKSEVEAWLAEEGFRSELAETVMNHSKLKLWNGKWLRWHGGLIEKAEVILRALGNPADSEELAREIGGNTAERSLLNALQSDKRFMRVRKNGYGLREWGLEEYSGIANEIAERIERAGGTVELESLVTDMVRCFGVAASSVMMYAEAPRFVLSNGMVRFREEHEIVPPVNRVRDACGLFPDPRRHRVHLMVTVDQDVLRGSGMGIRPEVAYALGIKPGERLHFDIDGTASLLVSWPDSSAVGPSLGSTRAIANATGAISGASILISFDLKARTAVAHMIPPNTTDLPLLTGLDIVSGRELDVIGESLGCDRNEVRAVLVKRGDHLVLNALPMLEADAELEAAIVALMKKVCDP